MTLLALVCLAVQAPSAEETLRKVEEVVQGADNLRLKFKVESRVRYRGFDWTNAGSGVLLLKKGNRIDFSLQTAVGQQTMDTRLLSDGSRMKLWSDGKERGDRPTDASLGSRVGSAFVRGGVSHIGVGLPSGVPSKKDPEISALIQLSDFREGSAQGNMRSISFKMKTPNPSETSNEVTLWFDSRSHLPLIRTTATKTKDAEVTTTETYEEAVVDKEIPDETFTLPAPPPVTTKPGKGAAAKAASATKLIDPWEGKAEGTWYRFKMTKTDQEVYSDVGLKTREVACNVIVGQRGEKGKFGPAEPSRLQHLSVTVLRQEAVPIQGRDYACDVVETSSGERTWVIKEGKYAGAVLKSVSQLGVYQAKTVWEHTLKVKGKEFECLVIEAELKFKDKAVPSKTWFCPTVPTHNLRIVSEGDTMELIDFGADWSTRPPFPGSPDWQT